MERLRAGDRATGGAGMSNRSTTVSKRDGIAWTIADGWESAIVGNGCPAWRRLSEGNKASLVKSNPRRRIWRVGVGGKNLFVKEFHEDGPVAFFRRLIRGCDARREWRAARMAEAAGLRYVKPVAWGVGLGISLLVSEEIGGAIPLSPWWVSGFSGSSEGGPGRGERCRVMANLARMAAESHAAGVSHGDHHPGNVLVGRDGRCTYLDVGSLVLSGGGSDERVCHSLAQLNQWFRRRATRIERVWFLLRYCRARCGGDGVHAKAMTRRLSPLVAAETDRQAVVLWRHRDGRIGRENAYFGRLGLPGGRRAWVTRRIRHGDLYPEARVVERGIDEWRESLERWLDGGVGDDGPGGVVAETIVEGRGLLDRMRRATGGSPARRMFVWAHRLGNRDIPCRRAAALIEAPARGGDDRSHILWDDPGGCDVVSCLRAMGRGQRRRLAIGLARLVDLMSERGASLGRLTASTLACDERGERFYVHDVGGVVLADPDRDRDRSESCWALFDLAQRESVFRLTDAVRFLQALAGGDWKSVWREVSLRVRGVDHG